MQHRASAGESPMASSTWDGSGSLPWQAEPAAMALAQLRQSLHQALVFAIEVGNDKHQSAGADATRGLAHNVA